MCIRDREYAADVYFNLAEELLSENHFDIALEQLEHAAQIIPEELQEEKFEPLVKITTEYTELCLKTGDIINAQELWKAACKFNELWVQSLIRRESKLAVEAIEEHLKVVRKFSVDALNAITLSSAMGSGRVLSEAKEHERAAKILVGFATDFLRKNLTEFADPLFEEGAKEFKAAKQPEEAARVLSALAKYHSDKENYEKSFNYYLLATLNSGEAQSEALFISVADQCLETATVRLNEDKVAPAVRTFEIAVQITVAVNKLVAAKQANDISKKLLAKNQFDTALDFCQQAIDFFFESSSISDAARVAIETIALGQGLFQKHQVLQSSNFINLGVEALYKLAQKPQAGQIARVEGEKFLESEIPSIGLNLLSRAIEIFGEIGDQNSIAEAYKTLGSYFITKKNFEAVSYTHLTLPTKRIV